MAGRGEAKSSVSPGEEAYVEKKFGGIAPKKPLISKDHERAYFDSADWVLGKQAANSSSSRPAVESLKPKLKNASSPASPSQSDLRIWLRLKEAHRSSMVKSSEKETSDYESSD